jgi:Uncharacterized Fe-S protein
MTTTVLQLCRYPIKSHGQETVAHAYLEPGQSFPFDRFWAVVDAARSPEPDGAGWAPCRNFLRGARSPDLMALTAQLDESRMEVTVAHPEHGDITFAPDDPQDRTRFFDWLSKTLPVDGQQPRQIMRAGSRGMTDTAFPSVSIMNMASHKAVVDAGGADQIDRWRGNIWLEGLPAWEECSWVGQRLRIGAAEFEVVEPIGRCRATEANTLTGRRDTNTLAILRDQFGHTDFGMYARVIRAGR